MQFNPRTYKYEGDWNGQPVVVDSDAMSEAQDQAAQDRFGVAYQDTTEAQAAAIDAELADPFNWATTDYNEAK